MKFIAPSERTTLAVVALLSLLWSFCPMEALAEGLASSKRIQYSKIIWLSVVKDREIHESSGLARSIVNPDTFWTHNDSGDMPRLFLIDRSGETVGTLIVEGVRAVDWEDIASFKRGERAYLLIGDVGDNRTRRKHCILYLVEEPRIEKGSEQREVRLKPSVTIRFTYEDGPHNCEAVAFDLTGGTIYLATKEDEDPSRIYALPLPDAVDDQVLVARKIATLKQNWVTAMDISPDGMRAIVLTYSNACEYVRNEKEPWATAFAREGRLIMMPGRYQGESICYGPDGMSLYLTSEGVRKPFWEVRGTYECGDSQGE